MRPHCIFLPSFSCCFRSIAGSFAVASSRYGQADCRRNGGGRPLRGGEVFGPRVGDAAEAGPDCRREQCPDRAQLALQQAAEDRRPSKFTRGIAAHATSKIVVRLPGPGKKFLCQIGLDNNEQTASGHGTVVFSVNIAGRNVFRSDVIPRQHGRPSRSRSIWAARRNSPWKLATPATESPGTRPTGPTPASNWPTAKTVSLGDLPVIDEQEGLFSADPPFSFTYNGRPSAEFLATWKVDRKSTKLDNHRTAHTVVYRDPAGGLSLRCEAVAYDDYPTVEWTLYFKNNAAAVTPIIENIQSLDVRWQRGPDKEYLLHHNIGAPADNTDYTPLESVLGGNSTKRHRRRRRPLDQHQHVLLQSGAKQGRWPHPRRRLARPVGRRFHPRRRSRPANPSGPGADPFQAASRAKRSARRSPCFSFGRAAIGSARKTSGGAG